MSIQYNDTSTYRGLLQLIAKRLGLPRTYFTEDADRKKEITAEINQTVDDYTALAIRSSGKAQFDDSNHTEDYPIIFINLVSGQRDYALTTDENGNLILEFYRVFARESVTSPYYELTPVDVQSDREGIISKLADGLNTQGTPYQYDKTANGIFVDPVPTSDVTNGIKIYINREGSYFTTSDTDKKPGVPGLHHQYFVDKPAYNYAIANLLEAKNDLEKAVVDWEGSERLRVTGKIQEYFSKRSKDERPFMSGRKINFI